MDTVWVRNGWKWNWRNLVETRSYPEDQFTPDKLRTVSIVFSLSLSPARQGSVRVSICFNCLFLPSKRSAHQNRIRTSLLFVLMFLQETCFDMCASVVLCKEHGPPLLPPSSKWSDRISCMFDDFEFSVVCVLSVFMLPSIYFSSDCVHVSAFLICCVCVAVEFTHFIFFIQLLNLFTTKRDQNALFHVCFYLHGCSVCLCCFSWRFSLGSGWLCYLLCSLSM